MDDIIPGVHVGHRVVHVEGTLFSLTISPSLPLSFLSFPRSPSVFLLHFSLFYLKGSLVARVSRMTTRPPKAPASSQLRWRNSAVSTIVHELERLRHHMRSFWASYRRWLETRYKNS